MEDSERRWEETYVVPVARPRLEHGALEGESALELASLFLAGKGKLLLVVVP